MKTVPASIFCVLSGVLLALGSVAGGAAPPEASGELVVDAHAEVAAVLYAASATQAAIAKSTDAQLRSQNERIKTLVSQLKTGDQRHRAEMIAAQETFVAALAAKDRDYSTQIALFRTTVTDIASTPEGAAALERFNAGDEIGAIAILDRLRVTNERMREERAKLENAAEGRRIAQLALEARTRGKIDTEAVIKRFEEVVKLDPGVINDWMELNRLYQDVGRLDDARKAVDALAAAAHDDLERAIGFSQLSDILLTQGDQTGSRKAAEEALAISRRLAGAEPKNVDRQRTLSRALIAFGEVARRQGDLDAAEKAYVEEIAISRSRLTGDPGTEWNYAVLASDLLHLADVLIARGGNAGARAALEENLGIQRKRSAAAPDSIVVPRQIAVSLMWLSDVLVNQGAFADARKANAEIVATASRLSAADPSNAVLKRDLVYGYSKTGRLHRIEGRYDEALSAYAEALRISRELAQPDAEAALDVKRDVATWLTQVAMIKYFRKDLEGARQDAEQGTAMLRVLASADETDVMSRQYLAGSLYVLGDALFAQGDYAGSRKAYEEGIALDLALLAKNADASDAQFDLSAGRLGVGTVLKQQGDPTGALRSLQESLEIRNRLAAADPASPTLQRGVAEVMRELAGTPGSKVTWQQFRSYVEAMERKGSLWPSDRAWLEEARKQSSSGART